MHHDQDQRLAVTLAGLLLVGGTLIVREEWGLWPAVAVGMVPVLVAYAAPAAARRIAVALAVHQLRRRLAAHERTAGPSATDAAR
jgi:predicted anti-sigma-YlaC factor YlaD